MGNHLQPTPRDTCPAIVVVALCPTPTLLEWQRLAASRSRRGFELGQSASQVASQRKKNQAPTQATGVKMRKTSGWNQFQIAENADDTGSKYYIETSWT